MSLMITRGLGISRTVIYEKIISHIPPLAAAMTKPDLLGVDIPSRGLSVTMGTTTLPATMRDDRSIYISAPPRKLTVKVK